jgi:hypothetical protein
MSVIATTTVSIAPDWIAAVNSSIDSELIVVSIPLKGQKKNSPSSLR